MKYLSALLLCFILVLPASIVTTGCNTPPDKTALNVGIGTRQSLATAWGVFRNLRAQGQIDDATYEKGAIAVSKYKQSYAAFLTTLKAYQTVKDEEPVKAALATVSAAWDSVYPILVKYYPQLSKTPPNPN